MLVFFLQAEEGVKPLTVGQAEVQENDIDRVPGQIGQTR
ncbi:MAG: hypothetical protein ACD_75C01420G0001, partial [uncultured bacterium]